MAKKAKNNVGSLPRIRVPHYNGNSGITSYFIVKPPDIQEQEEYPAGVLGPELHQANRGSHGE